MKKTLSSDSAAGSRSKYANHCAMLRLVGRSIALLLFGPSGIARFATEYFLYGNSCQFYSCNSRLEMMQYCCAFISVLPPIGMCKKTGLGVSLLSQEFGFKEDGHLRDFNLALTFRLPSGKSWLWVPFNKNVCKNSFNIRHPLNYLFQFHGQLFARFTTQLTKVTNYNRTL